MRIDHTPGFRSAEAAYENATPYDDDCTCDEDDMFICDECGETSDLPGTGECEEPTCELREATAGEKSEIRPAQKCPQHGYCTGCSSPSCECHTP